MRYFTILFAFISAFSFGQNYHLLPDTCTHCSYVYGDWTYTLMEGYYTLLPEDDTLYQGNLYMKVPIEMSYQNDTLFAVRQFGNKVLGIKSNDTINEYLIQDWESAVGDTIYNLYAPNGNYAALVVKDDSLLLNDGTYHHFRELFAIGTYENGILNTNHQWTIIWNERGLCGSLEPISAEPIGGLLYNYVPYSVSGIPYHSAHPHTPDLRYNLTQYVSGCFFDGAFADLNENVLDPLITYPNPSSGLIHLGETTFEISEIEILDLNGKSLLKLSAESKGMDISNFQNGIYFLRVKTTENAYHQTKIMKTE